MSWKSEPSDFSDRRLWIFYQTALIILSIGSDVMYDVALHQFVEYLLPRIWEPILCLYPLANSAYPLAERFAVDGFCQGYTCWLHACYAYRIKVKLTLQSRAIAIFHLTLGMMWWMMDNRCDWVGSWVVFICDGCNFIATFLVDWRQPYAWMVDCICANGSEQTRGWSPSGACNIG